MERFNHQRITKPKTVISNSTLSPLSLLALAACGGGGGGSSPVVSGSSSSGSSSFPVSGNAVAGPIDGAVAFVDYDEDGVLDADEPYAYTDGDGAFALTSTDADAPIVVTTDSTTAGGLAISAIDTSSDTSLTGITLKAPTGSSVISPTSTVAYDLMETNGLTEAEVATALGLEGVSILSFNPYADDVDADTALAVEKVASQVMTTVKAISAAAEGVGADGNAAASEAFASLVSVVQTKAAAGTSFDLSNAADLASVETQAVSQLATLVGSANATAFNATL
jgi:plasmid maintenance system antidote protein VapI